MKTGFKRITNYISRWIKWSVAKIIGRADSKNILFWPHGNCRFDGYDILNGESDNVLCLLNDLLRDSKFNRYHFYIVYHFKDRLNSYLDYCKPFDISRIHFVFYESPMGVPVAFSKCKYIFTDNTFGRFYKKTSQKVICLNYFAGFIKDDFFKWEKRGGFKRMLKQQRRMYNNYDYHLSCSAISSKFIALDNCMYYPRFVNLGFPRNDVFFKDYTELRKKIEEIVGFKVDHIISYVPTHRDYESSTSSFKFLYDKEHAVNRTLWGVVPQEEFDMLEKLLQETNTLVIAKIHPRQEKSLVSGGSGKHILYFSELSKHIKTSLNPILAISDYMITDYTTAVYDFLYTGRPIIYYFYDFEVYKNARGFFINPIQSICAGHISYNMKELISAIKELTAGNDPYAEKRKFIQELFIKDLDGNSTNRIKEYFFN